LEGEELDTFDLTDSIRDQISTTQKGKRRKKMKIAEISGDRRKFEKFDWEDRDLFMGINLCFFFFLETSRHGEEEEDEGSAVKMVSRTFRFDKKRGNRGG
jgi:hypothetical protein